jgi:hypothetical protein
MSVANLKQWKPGQSGNPNGRSMEMLDLMRLARKKCRKAIKVCEDLLEDTTMPASIRLEAAKSLFDRGMGRPLQPIAIEEPTPERELLGRRLTGEEIEAMVERMKQLPASETEQT